MVRKDRKASPLVLLSKGDERPGNSAYMNFSN